MNRVLVALCFLASIETAAQQDSSARQLEEIIVSTRRREQPARLLPYAVTAVSRKQLQEYGHRTVPEALQGIGGVFVQKTNHGGGSPFVRGLTGNQTLMLIDGIRLNNATYRYGPNQYSNTLDPYSVERIEIARGTGSVQYGSDALGGLIHVLTKDPLFGEKGAWHGGITGRFMTHGMEQTARAGVDYSGPNTAFTGGGTFRKFGDLYGGDTTGRQHPSGYDERAYNGKLKFRIDSSSTLTLATQFLEQRNVPVYHKVVLENFLINEMSRQLRNLHYVSYQKNFSKTWIKNLSMTASWQRQAEERRMQKRGSAVLLHEKDDVRTKGLTLSAFSQKGNGWSATTGFDLYLDEVLSSREEERTGGGTKTGRRGLYPDGGRHNSFSVYSLHQLQRSGWTLEAGLRFNAFGVHIQDTSVGNVTIRPSALIGNAGASYRLSPGHQVYAGVNNGFRVPNIDDLGTLGIVDFRYEVPAYRLRPERSVNYELGYKLQAEKLKGSLALFHMQLTDLIIRSKVDGQSIQGYPVYRKENAEQASIQGAEAALSWIVCQPLELRGNIAYARGQNKSKGEPLRRIPPLNGSLQGVYRVKGFYSTLEVVAASKQDRLAKGDTEDNRIPKGGTPAWTVINAYAGYQLKHVACRLGLQNLLNEDYRTHGSGINGVGRSLWISLTAGF